MFRSIRDGTTLALLIFLCAGPGSANDAYVLPLPIRVATLIMGEGVGSGSNEVCNVDAVGQDEYLARASGSVGIRIFRAAAPGDWQWVGSTYGPGGPFYTFDLNGNGLPEVIWQYTTTRIFESPATTTDPDLHFPSQRRLDITPIPCSDRATIRFSGSVESAAKCAVYDVRGRLLEQLIVCGSTTSILWRPRDLPAGVYLLRLEDQHGRGLASGRATIVH